MPTAPVFPPAFPTTRKSKVSLRKSSDSVCAALPSGAFEALGAFLLSVLNNENVLRPPEAAAVPPQHDSRAAL